MGCGSLGRHRNSRLVSMSIEMWSAKTPRRKTRMGVDFYVEKKTRDLFCAFESIVHAEGRLNQSNQWKHFSLWSACSVVLTAWELGTGKPATWHFDVTKPAQLWRHECPAFPRLTCAASIFWTFSHLNPHFDGLSEKVTKFWSRWRRRFASSFASFFSYMCVWHNTLDQVRSRENDLLRTSPKWFLEIQI